MSKKMPGTLDQKPCQATKILLIVIGSKVTQKAFLLPVHDNRSGQVDEEWSTDGVFGLIDHNYGEEGTYAVLISGHDYTTGSDVTGNDTMEIADAPLSLTPVAIEATTGHPWNGIVATFVDADPGTDQGPGDYVATITFPDGSVMPLAITQDSVAEGDNPNQFTISILPSQPKTFGMVGYLSPLLTVTEVQDATAIANGTPANSTTTTGIAYVGDGGSSGTPDVLTANPLPINATTRQPWSGPVATFTDSNPNATGFTAKITWAAGQITDGFDRRRQRQLDRQRRAHLLQFRRLSRWRGDHRPKQRPSRRDRRRGGDRPLGIGLAIEREQLRRHLADGGSGRDGELHQRGADHGQRV